MLFRKISKGYNPLKIHHVDKHIIYVNLYKIHDYILDTIKQMEYYICENEKLLFLKKM